MSVLKTEGVVMRFGGLIAVDDFSITLEQGEIVAVIGPNGAGKTTAFNVITGVYKPSFGKVYFHDRQIGGLRSDRITALGIARTFQNIRLFKDLTVLDNVLIATHLRKKHGMFTSVLHTPGALREEKAMVQRSFDLLERTGLLSHANDIATSLPYGLQRRLEIARALATEPTLLLLDEPAAGMNPAESHALSRFIRQIRDEFQLTVLLIEHHMQLVMDISDRIYVLEYGNTIATGTSQEIQKNPDVIRAYLGEEEKHA